VYFLLGELWYAMRRALYILLNIKPSIMKEIHRPLCRSA
jgi:hypothetical protein